MRGFAEHGPALHTPFPPRCFGCWEAELSSATEQWESPRDTSVHDVYLVALLPALVQELSYSLSTCYCISSPQNLAIIYYFYYKTLSCLFLGTGCELYVEVAITFANILLQPELCRADVGLAEASGCSWNINKQE